PLLAGGGYVRLSAAHFRGAWVRDPSSTEEMKKMKKLLFVLMSLVAAVPVAYGQDDGFPNKPIRIIVPFTPGSSADTASRFFGSQMADKLGQPFIVENRPGGSGAIAMSAVKNAAADGYTLFLASNSLMSVNPLVI